MVSEGQAFSQSREVDSGSAIARLRKLKLDAVLQVNAQISKGLIKKQPCEFCGNTKAQAHHDDYTKPLEVRWLCIKHHRAWHQCHIAVVPSEFTELQLEVSKRSNIALRQRGLGLGQSGGGVTIRDVAQRCGVSIMTVSRALRNQNNISPRTKAIVEHAAREVGYKIGCELCGAGDCELSVRAIGKPRKVFCSESCLVKFFTGSARAE